ncbi:hypothetical protein Bca52824_079274 [Brassica carinata]|uniref:Poly A polymerase head domain-containing protein n=1 Tax=Brassica carinata TaxID=52824 RepID=A0A8X7TYV9_BRACI|nr:hypothetical protein Bca52824_079274 [Brassica carinata]
MTTTTTTKLRDRIDLTDNKRKILDLLLAALRKHNLKTQLRVAGGWVRDKVLLIFLKFSPFSLYALSRV